MSTSPLSPLSEGYKTPTAQDIAAALNTAIAMNNDNGADDDEMDVDDDDDDEMDVDDETVESQGRGMLRCFILDPEVIYIFDRCRKSRN